MISQPLGGQGSSQQIGSDADDVTPRSQMLRGGIPRGVNHGDRLAAPGSEKPAIHQSKARLPNSQFQRSEPARQAASPRLNQPVCEELEVERCNKPRSCRAAIELQAFMIGPPPGRTEGRPYPVELPFHPSYLPIRDSRPAVSRLFAFLFASARRNGKIGLHRSPGRMTQWLISSCLASRSRGRGRH